MHRYHTNKCNQKPLISVCVITYQHAPYIKKCLDSILMQKINVPFEIIIGEDDSTDGTKKICAKYAQKFPHKIKLFLQSRKNVIYIDGHPTGRYNFVETLKSATGKYIAYIEGDDFWTDPYKLQKQFNVLEQHKDIISCHHWHRYLYPNKKTLNEAPRDGYLPCTIGHARDIFLNKLRIKSRTNMFRNVIEKDFFPKWFYEVAYGDVPFSFLLGQYGSFYFIDEPMAVYRQTANGASKAGKANKSKSEWTKYHFKKWIEIWKYANKHYNFKYDKEARATILSFYKKIIENS